jgi:hypothetical protein
MELHRNSFLTTFADRTLCCYCCCVCVCVSLSTGAAEGGFGLRGWQHRTDGQDRWNCTYWRRQSHWVRTVASVSPPLQPS